MLLKQYKCQHTFTIINNDIRHNTFNLFICWLYQSTHQTNCKEGRITSTVMFSAAYSTTALHVRCWHLSSNFLHGIGNSAQTQAEKKISPMQVHVLGEKGDSCSVPPACTLPLPGTKHLQCCPMHPGGCTHGATEALSSAWSRPRQNHFICSAVCKLVN